MGEISSPIKMLLFGKAMYNIENMKSPDILLCIQTLFFVLYIKQFDVLLNIIHSFIVICWCIKYFYNSHESSLNTPTRLKSYNKPQAEDGFALMTRRIFSVKIHVGHKIIHILICIYVINVCCHHWLRQLKLVNNHLLLMTTMLRCTRYSHVRICGKSPPAEHYFGTNAIQGIINDALCSLYETSDSCLGI